VTPARHHAGLVLLVLVIGVFAFGCGAREHEEAGECEAGQTRLSSTDVRYPRTMPPDVLDRSACDAARRAGVPVDTVRVVNATTETWSDASLDCPLPGHGYGAVNTDGFQVVVQAGERTFDYRTAKRTDGRPLRIILCEPP
jgi:hypothetical protein